MRYDEHRVKGLLLDLISRDELVHWKAELLKEHNGKGFHAYASQRGAMRWSAHEKQKADLEASPGKC